MGYAPKNLTPAIIRVCRLKSAIRLEGATAAKLEDSRYVLAMFSDARMVGNRRESQGRGCPLSGTQCGILNPGSGRIASFWYDGFRVI